ncbi:MAG: CBS domain-containing protein [Bacilli bacterium]|nr:CBS domain-containing protein [Bacilli bacterium]
MNIVSLLTPKAKVYTISTKMSVRQVLEIFDANKFAILPLLDEEGRYISTISEGDLLRFIKKEGKLDLLELEKKSILEVDVYRPYSYLKIDSPFEKIYKLSLEQNFIPLVDDRDVFIGIVKRKELLENLHR